MKKSLSSLMMISALWIFASLKSFSLQAMDRESEPEKAKGTTHGEQSIDIDDQTCADHMVMVFHAYDQSFMKQEVDFSKPVDISSHFLKIVPYKITRDALEGDLYGGWTFKPFYGKTGIKIYSWDWAVDSLIGMIGYHKERNIISIAYRGTQQFSDMWNNVNFGRRKCDYAPDTILLHSGYLDIFEASLPSLLHELNQMIPPPEENVKDPKVLITGYSLGGAVASMASLFLRKHFPESEIRLSVFGSPCVGTVEFNEWLGKSQITAKSFVRKTDYTPFNPSCYGLIHTGTYIELPDYGDRALAWPMAHDCRKYQRAIYEHLNQGERYKSLFSIHLSWLWNQQF